MKSFIPLSVPNLKGNELKYVTEAIENEWVSTGGKFINIFEQHIASYVKVQEAVACQSGTAGLHLALLLSGVKREDLVIVPTLTFIAAVNPVKYVGALPIFMDCDDTLTIDCEKLESFCEEECELIEGVLVLKTTKQSVRAIVVVHVFGNMANMSRVKEIASKYKLKVIEDATESLGTYYISGKYIGQYAGTIGDYGVYSFNGNKIITTGGGGMLIAQNPKDSQHAKYLSTQAKDDELYFIHNEIGYNYRMTNVQAAIGVAQLERLDEFIKTKKDNYLYYDSLLNEIEGIRLMPFREGISPNYWFYALVLEKEEYIKRRNQIIHQLQESGIQTRAIWGLIHKQKPYEKAYNYKIEKAEYYYDRVINLPCSSNLTKEDIRRVVGVLKSILENN
nr:LegC family aminotransferase [uncultured Niameybacter sp.]